MKSKFLMPLCIFLFLLSCDSGDDGDIDPVVKPDPLSGLVTKNVQIRLPEGAKLDFGTLKLFSNNLETSLSNTGEGKVLTLQENSSFAYVFDNQGNLILAGLIGPSRSEISIETTTEFLLYQAFAIPFRDDFFSTKFFEQVRQFPIWDQTLTLVKNQFLADKQMLGKSGIGENVNAIINPLLKESRLNPNAGNRIAEEKASDLLINGDIKSDLQAYQTGLNQFSIDNTARRRVHAFLYKTSFVDLDGVKRVLINFPGSSPTAVPDKEIPISMVNGVTGISSTIYEYLTNETEKTFKATSDPISIPLKANEKATNWDLRIVGVGAETSSGRNNVEVSRAVKLQMMTLTLDFVVPLIADAIAVKGLVSKGESGPKGEEFLWEAMITAVTGYVDKMPEVKGKINKGEYQEAVLDFFQIGWNQLGSIFLEDLAKIAAETVYNSLPKDIARPNVNTMKESASRKVKIIGAIDLVLKGSDYFRKVYDIKTNKNLEIWDLKAREIEVNLEPRQTTIEVQTEKKFTAYVKSTVADGQVLEYQWATSGKYGSLKDDKGHEGKAFTSSSKEVIYKCTAEADPSKPDRKDTITVEIFMKVGMKRYAIGKDVSIVEVGDKELFTVNWETRVNVHERIVGGKPEWTVSNGSFLAKFSHRPGAKAYDLQNVRADGTKANVVRRTPEQLKDEQGGLTYEVGVGSIVLFTTNDPKKRDERIAVIEKQLENVRHNYNRLEVTVIR